MPKLNEAISLDMVNIHYQEPNRNRFESLYFWEELYTLLSAAGFSSVEIPYDPFFDFGGRSGVPFTRNAIITKYTTIEKYKKFLSECGIISVSGVQFSPNMFMRNDDLDFYFGASEHFATEAIKHAGELDADYINFVATPYFGRIKYYHNDSDRFINEFLERTRSLINRLAEIAKQSGVMLTVKNPYWSLVRGEKVFEFLSGIDDSVRLCLDTANIELAGLDACQTTKKYQNSIGCVQFTDTGFSDDVGDSWMDPNPEFPQHKATQVFRDVGQGDVDLAGVYNVLAENGFSGWVTYSNRQTRDIYRSLLRTRYHIENSLIAQKSS